MKTLLFDFLPRATVIWGALAAYYLVWGRGFSPRAQRIFLLGSWLAGFGIPLLPALSLGGVPLAVDVPVMRYVGFAAGETPPITTTPQVLSNPFNWWQLLPIFYLTGLVLLVARARVQGRVIKQSMADGQREDFAGHPVVRSQHVTTPFAHRGRIFLPLVLSDPALTHTALIHEAAHLRLRHQIDKDFLTVCCLLLWFHPFVWVYRRLLATVHEYEADAAVLATVPRRVYARQLLFAAQGPVRGMGLFSSPLKQRITMITNRETHRRLRLLPAAALLVLLSGLFLACNADADLQDLEPSVADPELTRGVLYRDAPDMAASMNTLIKDIYQEIRYPASARNSGLTGRYRAKISIDETGQVSTVSAQPFAESDQAAPPAHPELTIVGYGTAAPDPAADASDLSAEIERALAKLGTFKPAYRKGKPYRGALVLDFNFILEPEQTGRLDTEVEIDGVKGQQSIDVGYPIKDVSVTVSSASGMHRDVDVKVAVNGEPVAVTYE